MSSSLQMLLDYSSEDGEEEMQVEPPNQFDPSNQEPDVDRIVKQVVNNLVARVDSRFRRFYAYRLSNLVIDSEDSSDSDEDEVPVIDDWFPSEDEESEEEQEGDSKPLTTKGELTIYDLPAIEKLSINVDVTELVHLGHVASIVDCLVVIESFRNIPALDLDTVLFSKDGQSLGRIFDTIGPVSHPSYVLRYNSHSEALSMNFERGQTPVYFAERRPAPITKFVFVHKLFQDRGCDASWEDDNEPPPEEIDYSDDEAEAKQKWKHTAKNRHRRGGLHH